MKWPIYIVVLLLVQIQWDIEIRHYQAKSRDPGDFGHFEPLKPDQSLSSHTGLGKTLLNVVVIASLTSVISWEEVQYNFAKVETLPRKCSKRVYIIKFSLNPKWHLWACQCVPNRNRAFPSARAYYFHASRGFHHLDYITARKMKASLRKNYIFLTSKLQFSTFLCFQYQWHWYKVHNLFSIKVYSLKRKKCLFVCLFCLRNCVFLQLQQ